MKQEELKELENDMLSYLDGLTTEQFTSKIEAYFDDGIWHDLWQTGIPVSNDFIEEEFYNEDLQLLNSYSQTTYVKFAGDAA